MNASSQDVLSQPEQSAEVVCPILAEAVDAAGLLLSYAVENGKITDEKLTNIIDTIVHSKRTLTSSCALKEEDEREFWSAYNKLCIATAPVSRESLNATTDKPHSTWWGKPNYSSISGDAVRNYQLTTIVLLFILLFFQCYWVLLSTILNDIPEIQDQIEKQENQANTENNAGEKEVKIKPLDDEIIESKRRAKEFDRSIRIELLYDIDFVGIFIEKITGNERRGFGVDAATAIDTQRKETAHITLKILSLYILPILYGLVGACAYILRTIARQIKERTFTNALKINLRLRLVLGALAGFSIAWFVGNASGVSGVITPLALAFLAGYSIELLFSAMDSLVEAFTRRETGQSKQA